MRFLLVSAALLLLAPHPSRTDDTEYAEQVIHRPPANQSSTYHHDPEWERIKDNKPVDMSESSAAAFCTLLMTKYNVIPHKGWGKLPNTMKAKWRHMSCDKRVVDANGLEFMRPLKAYGVKKGEPWRLEPWEPALPIPGPEQCDDQYDVRDLADLTLVSCLSPDRVGSLHHFLECWDGPVSLAMMVSNYTHALEIGKSVLDLILPDGTRIPVPYPERISLTLIEDVGYMCPNRVPTNMLRNHAVKNARTKYMVMLDIDFSIYPQKTFMQNVIHAVNSTMGLCMSNKAALILPGFETDKALNEIDYGVIPNKAKLKEYIAQGHISQFHRFYPPGHGPTQFYRWMDTNGAYRIEYEFGFEPYFIIRRGADLPPFDESFVGKGMNKVAWCCEVAAAGSQYWIMPEVFVVHKNHPTQEELAAMKGRRLSAEEAAVHRAPSHHTYGDGGITWPPVESDQDQLQHQDQDRDQGRRRLGTGCNQPVIRGNPDYKVLEPIGYSCLRKFDKKLLDLYGYPGPPVVYRAREQQLARSDKAFPNGCISDDPTEPVLPSPRVHILKGLNCGLNCGKHMFDCPICPPGTKMPCKDGGYCRGGS